MYIVFSFSSFLSTRVKALKEMIFFFQIQEDQFKTKFKSP